MIGTSSRGLFIAALLCAPLLAAHAQKKVDLSTPADPKDIVVVALVDEISDRSAYAEVVRYHSGQQRNIVLVPRRSASPGTIVEALDAVVRARAQDGKPIKKDGKEYRGDDPNLIQRFYRREPANIKAMPLETRTVAQSYFVQLMAAPVTGVRGANPSPAIGVHLAP